MSTCMIWGACGRPWQGLFKNEFNKTGSHFHAAYTATFNPVSLYDDCGRTGFASGSYLNWKILVFQSLRAAFALHGHAMHRTDPNDGPVTYWAERWGLVRYLPTIDTARQFLEQIGGRL